MRFIYITLLFLVLCISNQAKASSLEYVEPTLDRMVDLSFADGLVDLFNDRQLADYIRLKDCNVYKANINDDFKWQTLKKEWQAKAEENISTVKRHYKIPAVLKVDRYNFDTLAFDLEQHSQLQQAGYLELFVGGQLNCSADNLNKFSGKELPMNYQIKLETPFSMLRIPIGQALGKRILEELELDSNKQQRLIYLITYVSVDAMDHLITNILGREVAVGAGRIDKIEFYVDQERTRRFKTLYPSED